MTSFIFRCPVTGSNVQGWIAEDVSSEAEDEFFSIRCTACRQSHFVNASTGRVLGENSGNESG